MIHTEEAATAADEPCSQFRPALSPLRATTSDRGIILASKSSFLISRLPGHEPLTKWAAGSALPK